MLMKNERFSALDRPSLPSLVWRVSRTMLSTLLNLPVLVGWGGFKGPPEDGVVELGYELAEARQGAGLATAATRAMLEESFADDRVIAVIAHTLAEPNASNRVLEKAGFSRDGQAEEDGTPLWRYALLVRPAP